MKTNRLSRPWLLFALLIASQVVFWGGRWLLTAGPLRWVTAKRWDGPRLTVAKFEESPESYAGQEVELTGVVVSGGAGRQTVGLAPAEAGLLAVEVTFRERVYVAVGQKVTVRGRVDGPTSLRDAVLR